MNTLPLIEGAVLDPVTFDDTVEFWAELDEDGNVYTDWSKYSHSEPFTYYKIVRSQDNDNPVYPKDGYVYFTENADELTWTDTDVPFGVSWYRICQIAEPKRYCSTEVYKITKNAPLKTAIAPLAAIDTSKIQLEKIGGTDSATQAGSTAEESGSAEDGGSADSATQTVKPVLRPDQIAEKVAAAAANKRAPTSIESFITEYWVQFLALIVSLIGVGLAVTGFTFAGRKKKKSVSKFLNSIDDTFAAFKWKSKRCEAELYRLHDLVDEQLKKGKLDESSYELLHKRIERYLAEIKEIDNLPPHLKEKI